MAAGQTQPIEPGRVRQERGGRTAGKRHAGVKERDAENGDPTQPVQIPIANHPATDSL